MEGGREEGRERDKKAGKGKSNASEDPAEAPSPGTHLYARLAQFPEDIDLQTCTVSREKKAGKGKGNAAQEPADTPFSGTYGGRGEKERGTKAPQLKTLLKPPPVVPTSTPDMYSFLLCQLLPCTFSCCGII